MQSLKRLIPQASILSAQLSRHQEKLFLLPAQHLAQRSSILFLDMYQVYFSARQIGRIRWQGFGLATREVSSLLLAHRFYWKRNERYPSILHSMHPAQVQDVKAHNKIIQAQHAATSDTDCSATTQNDGKG